jgi:hypothetical protein
MQRAVCSVTVDAAPGHQNVAQPEVLTVLPVSSPPRDYSDLVNGTAQHSLLA